MSISQLYNTSEQLYKTFFDAENGKNSFNSAFNLYPKMSKGGKDTRQAVSHIFTDLGNWLYEHEPILNEIEIEAYLDTHGESLHESIQDSLIEFEPS